MKKYVLLFCFFALFSFSPAAERYTVTESQLTALESIAERYKTLLSEQTARLETLTEQLSASETRAQSLSRELSEQKARAQDLQTTCEALRKSSAELSESLKAAETSAKSFREYSLQLESSLSTEKEKNADITAKYERVNSKYKNALLALIAAVLVALSAFLALFLILRKSRSAIV